MTAPSPKAVEWYGEEEAGRLAERCRKKFDLLIEPIRRTARMLGYAIAVHGSIARDIDLVAVPWTDHACAPRVLAAAVERTVKRVNGFVYVPEDRKTTSGKTYANPDERSFGRLAWEMHLGGGPYIDLSVFPPKETPRG